MKSELTDNEKNVMWASAEYPGLKDADASEKIGLKRRTFSSVRSRLEKKGAFSTLVVPSLSALGCEVYTIAYGSFNPFVEPAERIEGFKMLNECDEVIYLNSTDREFFVMSASENYTQYMEKEHDILRYYKEKDFLRDCQIVHFPVKSTNYRFFGFSDVIKNRFELDFNCGAKDLQEPCKRARLTKKEKIMLYAIVKYPDAKNSKIASLTGITEHSVGEIKKRLFEKKIIETHTIPDFNILGCELFALVHAKYRLRKTSDYGCKGADILKFKNKTESISLSLFKTYIEYKRYYDEKSDYLEKNDIIREKPVAVIFPVERFVYAKDFSFGPLVKKVLDIDADF